MHLSSRAPICQTRLSCRAAARINGRTCRRSLTCVATSKDGPQKAPDNRVVPLPNAVWLLRQSPENVYKVFGPNFLMHPQIIGGLVPSAKVPKTLQVVGWQKSKDVILGPSLGSSTGTTVEQNWVDIDVSLSEDLDTSSTSCDAGISNTFELSAGTPMLGIVLHTAALPTVQDDQDENNIFETSSSSPRRTRKIKFTCNRCKATNIKPINPHAWLKGTVFAKCSNCRITHKLIDNLKLFHEMAGPVFPAYDTVLGIELPPGLPVPSIDLNEDELFGMKPFKPFFDEDI